MNSTPLLAPAPPWTASCPRPRIGDAASLLPGIGLCAAVTGTALVVEKVECLLFGRPWLDALVLSIVIGTAVRSVWTPGARWLGGIAFSAKTVLEIAVALLGVAISFRSLTDVGPDLLIGIAGVVVLTVLASFTVCRLMGLPPRMAVLVACGNSICGNSAIAAVAPVIGADGDEVASSIAFTAVLGVAVVLGLPMVVQPFGFSATQFGVFAGLTVYAVPQVIAAAAPLGTVAIQLGTLVKLVRVLMLGPIVLALTMLRSHLSTLADAPAPYGRDRSRPGSGRVSIRKLVPWFIVAFLLLATLRTLNLIPTPALSPVATLADGLTILSMAALGLGVDVRVVARAGARVTGAVLASLLLLGAASLALIHGLGVL